MFLHDFTGGSYDIWTFAALYEHKFLVQNWICIVVNVFFANVTIMILVGIICNKKRRNPPMNIDL